jgi:hypothetical protein
MIVALALAREMLATFGEEIGGDNGVEKVQYIILLA